MTRPAAETPFVALSALVEAGIDGAGAILLTEEALEREDVTTFIEALAAQPAWSDIPVLVFAGGDRARLPGRILQTLEGLTNVTTIERPIRVAAVFSIVRAALRARARQYDMCDVLVSLHTARRQAEEASRLKDEFLATLSHELRTPLNAILGWTTLLRRGSLTDAVAHNGIQVIERNARAQAQLIEDLLDMSRIISGRIRLEPQPLDLTEVVESACESVRPSAEAK